VYAVSDRITVLRNGKLVGESPAKDLPRLNLVARMVGKDPAELATEQASASHTRSEAAVRADRDHPLVEVQGLGRRHAVEPLDLSIGRGEIVGLAGLLGSGRTETAELLFGVRRHDAGRILVDGQPRRIRAPRHAIALGLGFCPEDRKAAGILPDLSVRENIAIALQARRGWWRPLSWRRQRAIADRYIRDLRIKTNDAEKPIRFLSGGQPAEVHPREVVGLVAPAVDRRRADPWH
jgi:simple sugar transport system ATP-binding protein